MAILNRNNDYDLLELRVPNFQTNPCINDITLEYTRNIMLIFNKRIEYQLVDLSG